VPDHAATRLVLGTFGPFTPEARAVTYSQALVPAGATAAVVGTSGPHGTIVTLAVRGLVPSRGYGAHVHTRTCGPAPADSGPHYQNVPDPRQPSVDPAYANPANEIWLDFTTDPAGNGAALSTVNWTFAGRQARSVVIHEHHTHTGDGQAGTAGARLACVKVEF
jgi:Cu-Zn family superoxide dismutase